MYVRNAPGRAIGIDLRSEQRDPFIIIKNISCQYMKIYPMKIYFKDAWVVMRRINANKSILTQRYGASLQSAYIMGQKLLRLQYTWLLECSTNFIHSAYHEYAGYHNRQAK